MQGFPLLGVYGFAIFIVSLLGTWFPRRLSMTHNRTQMTLSLVSGLMLGVAFCHLIPHSYEANRDIYFVMLWALSGLIFMLMLLRLFQFHQHEFGMPDKVCPIPSEEAHRHNNANPTTQLFGAMGLILGLCIHSVIDGMALGAVILSAEGSEGLFGAGVFFAIFLHKPLDAFSIETVMAATGSSSRLRWLVGICFAFLCPAAAFWFYLGVGPIAADGWWLAAALGFSAGAFICIALSDLLPEVQFHSHDRVRLTLLFLFGISLALLFEWFEPAHSH